METRDPNHRSGMSRMLSPYEALPSSAFWKTGVAEQQPDAIEGLYRKKFAIRHDTIIATAGSCFAQHISRHLRARGFRVADAEPAPDGLDSALAQKFGYGLYSARYGNIYTVRQLRQLAEEAFEIFRPADMVWNTKGRYFDALRPSVEPNGLSSAEAVLDHRAYHLRQVRDLLGSAEVFVFTLGLTEAWIHAETGTVYPIAPGVLAGAFDPKIHQFKNYTFSEIYADLSAFFSLVHAVNPKMRFILTVSPVPLTATAGAEHVLRATTYSKSVLRAVAGQFFQERDDVDYVPSYEVITSALSRGQFFEQNLRSVRREGVDAVMRMFFTEHGGEFELSKGQAGAEAKEINVIDDAADVEDELVCEEAFLQAFAQ
jgi:hypothetical protein